MGGLSPLYASGQQCSHAVIQRISFLVCCLLHDTNSQPSKDRGPLALNPGRSGNSRKGGLKLHTVALMREPTPKGLQGE